VTAPPGQPTTRLLLASVVFVLFALLAVVMQRSLLARLPLAQPDLLALVVACGALARGPRVAAVWGLLAGMLADLAPPAGGVAGVWAFAFASTGFVVSLAAHADRRGGRHPFRRTTQDPHLPRPRLAHGVAAAAGSVIATFVHLAGIAAIGQPTPDDVRSSLVVPAVAAAYAFVVGLAVGRPLTRLLAPAAGAAW
jgi:rod shape-determining protein MreD